MTALPSCGRNARYQLPSVIQVRAIVGSAPAVQPALAELLPPEHEIDMMLVPVVVGSGVDNGHYVARPAVVDADDTAAGQWLARSERANPGLHPAMVMMYVRDTNLKALRIRFIAESL